jgi:hypothetical protein
MIPVFIKECFMPRILFFSFLLCLVFPLNLFSSPPEQASSPPAGYIYPGWVHLQTRKMPSTQPAKPEEDEDASIENTKETEFYINKKESAQCVFLDLPNEKTIRLFLPKQGEMMEYNSKYKGVALGTMHSSEAQRIAGEVAKFSLTVDEMVRMIKESQADIVGTQETKDGPYMRYHIVFTGGSLCSGKEIGGYNTIWYDPKTRLIQRLRANFGQGDLEMRYTYLTKPIKDLFDLGVPRDSMILDSRPGPEAKKLLDRLDGRFEKDYGDYVAVLTQTNHGKRWGSTPQKMFLYLYGRQGPCAFYGEYSLRGNDYPDSPLLKIQGWPNPELGRVLELAGKSIPVFSYATDGQKTWTGTFNAEAVKTGRFREFQSPYKKNPIQNNYRLANHLWKGRDTLFLWGFGPQQDLITDKNHPGTLGLRLREGDFGPKAQALARTEKIFWIDPTRDDLPVEATTCEEKFMDPKKTPATIEFKTRYQKFARLPDGQWFPTHWENRLSRKDMAGKTESFSLEYQLQIFPSAKLDPSWYTSRVAVLKVGEVKELGKIKPLNK